MKRLRISLDFDGTLVEDKYPNVGSLKKDVLVWLLKKQKEGHLIFLNTLRQGDLLSDAINFCEGNGIKLAGVIYGKPHADIFLDDKNMIPSDIGVNIKPKYIVDNYDYK